MYIARVPNRRSPPAILLREGYREGGKVKTRTLANLSKLPPAAIDALQRVLRGETLVSPEDVFQIVPDGSRAHGHVQAVMSAMRRLGFDKLVASRPSRQRNLVVAMVAARILAPEPPSKLATTRWWHSTTLPDVLGVADADEDDLYDAMDWLLKRQSLIEKKLARRHLEEKGLVLYDLSSSYFEGVTCPLAAWGHNRDGKKGKLQVNWGLLTNPQGIPVSITVFDGDTNDTKTLLPQVAKMRGDFGFRHFVLVGDRGMITQKQIDDLEENEGVNWITALRSDAIRKLVEGGQLQLGLFDERNLFEISHPDFEGQRLVACRNPELARRRMNKRQSLLQATAEQLQKVQKMTQQSINQAKVDAEAALDGIYVVRTNLPQETMDSDDTVRSYKLLTQVERAIRSMKTVDIRARPIHHRYEDRVRAHFFICMLAYYVEWHLIEAWRPLLFCDEDQAAKATRDPVAPAKRSEGALRKAATKRLDDGSPVHSLHTLLGHLAGIVRNTCRRVGAGPDEPTFHMITPPNPKQQRAYDLLNTINV